MIQSHGITPPELTELSVHITNKGCLNGCTFMVGDSWHDQSWDRDTASLHAIICESHSMIVSSIEFSPFLTGRQVGAAMHF